jgi:hypothetical protein
MLGQEQNGTFLVLGGIIYLKEKQKNQYTSY